MSRKVWVARRSRDRAPDKLSAAAQLEQPWRLSRGEIHFLWHFIDGSIMNVETRAALRRAWGMCPRHGFGFLAVEAAFRSGFMHGPAVLYEDVMSRAVAATRATGAAPTILASRRLREAGPCLMCSIGYGPTSRGQASRSIVERGSDVTAIHRFVSETAPAWRRWICGRCAGTDAAMRCRPHLREDLSKGSASLEEQRRYVTELAFHMERYARSFRWELRRTDTADDRAALIGAVGWCSGWRIWLDFAALPDPGGRATARNPARDTADH